jgi:drug/metabolite transporter (DMT)-like permease
MTALALSLVLTAAVLHATWNLLSKRAGGGLPFVLLVGIVNVGLYVPVVAAYWLWRHPVLPAGALAWIAGSAVIKMSYLLLLQRSYRAGDYSLVYPLVRGTGPLLATVFAILVFGERPGIVAVLGGLLIVASVFLLAGGARLLRQDRGHLRPAVACGLATAVFMAAYTLWDRRGVAALGIPPLLYDAGTTVVGVLLLAPFSARRWPEVARHWRLHRLHVFGVAGLSSVAYILVLTALSFTLVSYIAPAREVSIVIGAFLGARYLKEESSRRRLWAAGGIAMGIVLLAVG